MALLQLLDWLLDSKSSLTPDGRFQRPKKGEVPRPKHGDFFLVAQDMVLSHRAKFQLIINFFRVKAIFTGLIMIVDVEIMKLNIMRSKQMGTLNDSKNKKYSQNAGIYFDD